MVLRSTHLSATGAATGGSRAGGCGSWEYSSRVSTPDSQSTLPSEHGAISAAVIVAGISVFPVPDIRIVAIHAPATRLLPALQRGPGEQGSLLGSVGESRASLGNTRQRHDECR